MLAFVVTKSALSLSITNLKIPYSDFKIIHQCVMNKCQSVWEKQTENKLHELKPDFNIGIKHGFSCINVCQVPREVLKTEAEGRGFQHLPRDLANVNVLENNV